jgi:hypothetical protein
MRRPIGFLPVALAAVALSAWACDNNNTPTLPTAPDPRPPVTETFTGTVNPNGAVTHSFSTESAGTLTATLVSVTPDSGTKVGLSLGTWNGVACKVEIAADNAQQGVTVTGTASALGAFCARVYDVGALTGNISYELRVTHP